MNSVTAPGMVFSNLQEKRLASSFVRCADSGIVSCQFRMTAETGIRRAFLQTSFLNLWINLREQNYSAKKGYFECHFQASD